MTDRSRRACPAAGVRCLLASLLLSTPPAVSVAQGPADWLLPPFTANPASLRAGDPAPTLTWTTADGDPASLAALRGEVVVVVFWASWCPWCRQLWPVLEEIAEDHPARPRVVPVNVWDEAGAAEGYAARSDFTWPLLIAREGEAERWFVVATPHTVIVDAGGRIAGVVSGFDPGGAAIRAALDRSREAGDTP